MKLIAQRKLRKTCLTHNLCYHYIWAIAKGIKKPSHKTIEAFRAMIPPGWWYSEESDETDCADELPAAAPAKRRG